MRASRLSLLTPSQWFRSRMNSLNRHSVAIFLSWYFRINYLRGRQPAQCGGRPRIYGRTPRKFISIR